MCAWAIVAGAAISVVGGSLLADDHGAGAANAASADAAHQQTAIAQDQWDTYKQTYQPLEKAYAGQAEANVSQQYAKAHQRL